jgi:hypothetical protein
VDSVPAAHPIPDGHSANRSLSAIEPVSATAKRKLENGEQRPAPIYDPLANSWTPVAPPFGGAGIGDASGIVLANGRFMLAPVFAPPNEQALLNLTDFSWTPRGLSWTPTGSGKADRNAEEGWTLLPNGEVLTVDVNNPGNLTNSEVYRPWFGSWVSAGSTIVKLDATNADGSGPHEIGPQVLRPDGTVFAVGATGHTSLYNTVTKTWKAGPDFPVINGLQYDVADGPASVLPSGNVLVAASPGVFKTPTHFFVFDGTKLTKVADTPNATRISSFEGFMLVLPTGQVMFNSRMGDIELYTDTGRIASGAAPEITAVRRSLVAGERYPFYGLQLNGVSQGAAYGDDYQSATNYPLVRIVIAKTGHVFYARTSDFSMSVAHDVFSWTYFEVPARIETGEATLYAVANGIPSRPVSVTTAAPFSVVVTK